MYSGGMKKESLGSYWKDFGDTRTSSEYCCYPIVNESFTHTLNSHTQLTHSITPCSTVLLEKLRGPQLFKKFPAFYGTRRFVTAVTRARHLSLSSAILIQSIPPHYTSWRPILMLSTHLRLGLPSGLFPSDFPTKTLCAPLSSPIRATCSFRVY